MNALVTINCHEEASLQSRSEVPCQNAVQLRIMCFILQSCSIIGGVERGRTRKSKGAQEQVGEGERGLATGRSLPHCFSAAHYLAKRSKTRLRGVCIVGTFACCSPSKALSLRLIWQYLRYRICIEFGLQRCNFHPPILHRKGHDCDLQDVAIDTADRVLVCRKLCNMRTHRDLSLQILLNALNT